ncbi:SAM-dependent methyltransferase [Actinomadura rudentiformis]|uniref:SAM-dependent methyltransferase n=2 Tax=Actinomadura rudentiformis TaxID=359158 RepID=A0A6H9YXE6_9ACTN|nr:SAM-dependent methyltransferase [Actinomadura rudentiformis]
MDGCQGPGGIDLSVPNVARMYDYYLGGKDNYAADRALADQVLKVAPQTPALAQENRAFLQRAVRYLAGPAGIDQFIDIGAGLPTLENTHEVAQRVAPDARVVYVDNDPVVLAHGRALLQGAAGTRVAQADARRPDDIFGSPEVTGLIDLDRPVAILLVSVLHCLRDDEDPWKIVARLRDETAPGSHLVISHITAADHAESAQAGADVYRSASNTMTLRTHTAIRRFFDGFELLEPGLVRLTEWRPQEGTEPRRDLPTWYFCGVGRKP